MVLHLSMFLCSYCTRVYNSQSDCASHESLKHAESVLAERKHSLEVGELVLRGSEAENTTDDDLHNSENVESQSPPILERQQRATSEACESKTPAIDDLVQSFARSEGDAAEATDELSADTQNTAQATESRTAVTPARNRRTPSILKRRHSRISKKMARQQLEESLGCALMTNPTVRYDTDISLANEHRDMNTTTILTANEQLAGGGQQPISSEEEGAGSQPMNVEQAMEQLITREQPTSEQDIMINKKETKVKRARSMSRPIDVEDDVDRPMSIEQADGQPITDEQAGGQPMNVDVAEEESEIVTSYEITEMEPVVGKVAESEFDFVQQQKAFIAEETQNVMEDQENAADSENENSDDEETPTFNIDDLTDEKIEFLRKNEPESIVSTPLEEDLPGHVIEAMKMKLNGFHEENLNCLKCRFQGQTRRNLYDHWQRCHTIVQGPHMCNNGCDMAFLAMSDRDTHEQYHDPGNMHPITCSRCKVIYRNQARHDDHKAVCQRQNIRYDRLYQCARTHPYMDYAI